MRAAAVGMGLLVGAVSAAAELPEAPTCLPDVVREWCPGFLAIEPDTGAGCVWWFDVRWPDRTVRFHFPTKVRCEEARQVAVAVGVNVEATCH